MEYIIDKKRDSEIYNFNRTIRLYALRSTLPNEVKLDYYLGEAFFIYYILGEVKRNEVKKWAKDTEKYIKELETKIQKHTQTDTQNKNKELLETKELLKTKRLLEIQKETLESYNQIIKRTKYYYQWEIDNIKELNNRIDKIYNKNLNINNKYLKKLNFNPYFNKSKELLKKKIDNLRFEKENKPLDNSVAKIKKDLENLKEKLRVELRVIVKKEAQNLVYEVEKDTLTGYSINVREAKEKEKEEELITPLNAILKEIFQNVELSQDKVYDELETIIILSEAELKNADNKILENDDFKYYEPIMLLEFYYFIKKNGLYDKKITFNEYENIEQFIDNLGHHGGKRSDFDRLKKLLLLGDNENSNTISAMIILSIKNIYYQNNIGNHIRNDMKPSPLKTHLMNIIEGVGLLTTLIGAFSGGLLSAVGAALALGAKITDSILEKRDREFQNKLSVIESDKKKIMLLTEKALSREKEGYKSKVMNKINLMDYAGGYGYNEIKDGVLDYVGNATEPYKNMLGGRVISEHYQLIKNLNVTSGDNYFSFIESNSTYIHKDSINSALNKASYFSNKNKSFRVSKFVQKLKEKGYLVYPLIVYNNNYGADDEAKKLSYEGINGIIYGAMWATFYDKGMRSIRLGLGHLYINIKNIEFMAKIGFSNFNLTLKLSDEVITNLITIFRLNYFFEKTKGKIVKETTDNGLSVEYEVVYSYEYIKNEYGLYEPKIDKEYFKNKDGVIFARVLMNRDTMDNVHTKKRLYRSNYLYNVANVDPKNLTNYRKIYRKIGHLSNELKKRWFNFVKSLSDSGQLTHSNLIDIQKYRNLTNKYGKTGQYSVVGINNIFKETRIYYVYNEKYNYIYVGFDIAPFIEPELISF